MKRTAAKRKNTAAYDIKNQRAVFEKSTAAVCEWAANTKAHSHIIYNVEKDGGWITAAKD